MAQDLGPRYAELVRELERRILVIDGAMGTLLQAHGLSEDEYRGERLRGWAKDVKGNHELLNLRRPDVVEAVHRQYLAAGADIVETNTFNANRISQADYGLEALVHEMNVAAARDRARRAVDAVMAAEPGRTASSRGALGPTNRTASLSRDVNDPGARGVTFDELVEAYDEQARGLLDGGADLLLRRDGVRHAERQGALFADRDACSRETGSRPAGDRVGHDHRPVRDGTSPGRRSRPSGSRSRTAAARRRAQLRARPARDARPRRGAVAASPRAS